MCASNIAQEFKHYYYLARRIPHKKVATDEEFFNFYERV